MTLLARLLTPNGRPWRSGSIRWRRRFGGSTLRSWAGGHVMIEAGQLRPGSTIVRNGELFQVLSYDHVVLGRGRAIVRTKLKNLSSDSVTSETFRPEEKFSVARIERKEAQYLYRDGDSFV